MSESALPISGYAAYAMALLTLWVASGMLKRLSAVWTSRRHHSLMEFGSAEPPTLHPVIDPARCVGCGACTHACPEGRIIGMVDGKAALLDPGACIGHGACRSACPVGAIDLVFGTARRGVEIPLVSSDFESNVSGVFIAGELGGMGLIANAIEQGRQAMTAIARLDGIGEGDRYDVVVVGAGPAGISASLAAKQLGLRCLTLEQQAFGGTVARYPRNKLVMTRPADLPLYGRMRLRRVRKEALLAQWSAVIQKTGLQIWDGIRVERIERGDDGFVISSTAGVYRTRAVLLATGRRGSPRRLGVPGEDLPKVVYSLDDPSQYRGRHVLIVGGGDSALEAAATLARLPLASLTVSYRGEHFTRAKPALRHRIEEAAQRRRLTLLMESHIAAIEPGRVLLRGDRGPMTIPNDAVIICAGGLLPTALLADIGVTMETRYGTP